jgi:hypothetical protein
MKVFLLDLNHTLVSNPEIKTKPFSKQIQNEEYRIDLINVLKEEYVIIVTARQDKYKQETLTHLRKKTGWNPRLSYFNDLNLTPPEFKERILNEHIFLNYQPESLIAIESNSNTREMYKRNKIKALTFQEFLEMQ